MHKRSIVVVLTVITAVLLSFLFTRAENNTKLKETEEEYESRMNHWRKARFGMFIHWGPVSLTGHEIGWSRGKQTPVKEYDLLYKRFNPEKFNADEWARTAADTGMKYMVITTKHHDGFCLWPSRHTDYHIGNTPFKRDVLKELSEACKKHNIEFGTYYSVCDWYHPDYPMGSPGGRTEKPNPNLNRYIRYLRNQVTELVTKYGPLWVMWFDVPRGVGSEHGIPTIEMLRRLQPGIVINCRAYMAKGKTKRAGRQYNVGDYSTPEQHIGGFDRTRPWETCMTICRQWAWKPDDNMKSLKQCIQTLVQVAGGDGNFLFNVGPMPDGRIEPRQVERLKEMGEWLKKYNESIYATRGGPFMPFKSFSSTCKDRKIYLHLMNNKQEVLLPKSGFTVKNAKMLTGGDVIISEKDGDMLVRISDNARNEIDAIVVLETDCSTVDIKPVSVAEQIKARASNVYNKKTDIFGPGKALDGDLSTRWATDGNIKKAWIEFTFIKEREVSRLKIKEISFQRIREFTFQYFKDGSWHTCYQGTTVGKDFNTAFKPIKAKKFRLDILDAPGGPTIEEIILE